MTAPLIPESTAPGAQPDRFPALDTLRAVGALAVLATHCGFNAAIYHQGGALGRMVARLDVGVAIFFVLSGFLLSRGWLKFASTASPRPEVRHYLWKRLLRIYPAYAVTVIIAFALIPENRDDSITDWFATAVMGDIYFSRELPHGLTQTWSLATEVAFYAVLPVLMLVMVGRKPGHLSVQRVGLTLIALVVFNYWWLLDLSGRFPIENGRMNEWLPAYLTWFAAGILLAVVEVAPQRLPRLGRMAHSLARSPGVCWVAALGLLLLASTPLAGPASLEPATATEAVVKNALYAGVAVLLVTTGIWPVSGSRYERSMTSKLSRRLGHISYGIFLIHMPILHLVMWVTGYELFLASFWVLLVLTTVLSVAAAELLYRLIEVPFMRLKDLGRPRATKPDAAPRTSTTR